MLTPPESYGVCIARRALARIVALLATVALVTPRPSVSEAGANGLIINSPAPQINSIALSGTRVIWTATQIYPLDGKNPRLYIPSTLFAYDLRTRKLGTAARTQYGAQGGIYLYRIAGERIAYLDTGVTPFRWSLIVRDLRTGTQEVVAHSEGAGAPEATPSLALSRTTLVWVDQRMENGQSISLLYTYDLTTHRSLRLAEAEPHVVISQVALDGERCAWEQDRYDAGRYTTSIVLYDIAMHRQLPLTEAVNASQPAVDGSYVAWKTGPSAVPGQVVLYDSSTHKRVPVPAGPGTYSPTIGDNFLAWSSGPTGVVEGYNLRLHRRLALPLPESRSGFSAPVATDHMLAYAYTTNVPIGHGQPLPRGYIRVVPVF